MRQKYLFFLLFPLISLACAMLIPANPDADRPLSTVFDNLACEPPCWNHIVPGTTTYEHLIDTLSKISTDKSEITEILGHDETFVYYKKYYPISELTRDQVIFKLVDNIVLELEFESFFLHLPLSYILNKIGKPDYAIREMYGEIGWMTILHYPERGIEVWCMPRSFLVIGSIGCNLGSDVRVYFYSPENYETRLVEKYGSLEKAGYAQKFFCPWVGVEAQYLSVDWGPIIYPGTPTALLAEITSQCPIGVSE